ncbi:hypothetical protein [Caldicellulosiruptor acetigenus]|uniref:Uncharacterized protein n=1 Tax=Caldicellulosiruptor acetigenus 6A TaxID=632516 RepID=G2PVM5_9FIRM|nr:hypothetical protein [Caldicellulosiruptor acetigenus]AEM74625.1 hypothetical protein Calla_2061 [Caldicellulosiruptor acetigenus 6A]
MNSTIESRIGICFEQLNEEEMLEAMGGNPWLGTPTTAALSTTFVCGVVSGLVSAAVSVTVVITKKL